MGGLRRRCRCRVGARSSCRSRHGGGRGRRDGGASTRRRDRQGCRDGCRAAAGADRTGHGEAGRDVGAWVGDSSLGARRGHGIGARGETGRAEDGVGRFIGGCVLGGAGSAAFGAQWAVRLGRRVCHCDRGDTAGDRGRSRCAVIVIYGRV